ncbi:MAG: hypothetical protein E7439_07060 [Ruminococcaceae bacterium]|nr:hypothetical protein [Oscillospiraceae bacterium]
MVLLKQLAATFLCFMTLVGASGCGTQTLEIIPSQSVNPSEVTAAAAEAYSAARQQLLTAENRILQYTVSKSRTVGTQSYAESATGTASFSGLGTDALIAVIDEKLTYGTVTAEYLLSFCNGTAYSRISGSTFACELSRESFMEKQLPPVLLDAALYGSISQTTDSDGISMVFSSPTALEGWVTDLPGAQLISAQGTASLDVAGALIQTGYSAAYTCGGISYSLEITLRCSTPAQLELSALHPEHPEECPKLSCLEAPKLLLQTAGDIFAAQSIQAQATETLYSEAIPVTRLRQIQVSSSGSGADLSANLSFGVEVTDYRGQVTTSSQAYQISGNLCKSSIDGAEPKDEPGITAEIMRTSIEDTVLSPLFATRYLAGAEITEEETCYTLVFTGNEAYATDLCRDLGAYLDLDLEGNATSHHSTQASGYLSIDKVTSLPVAMGMYFTRTHVFGDVPYVLDYRLDQTLTLG